MKTSIALIGFMATGKTAVGELLAKKLHKEFIELDAVIAEHAGKSIPDIFGQDGEIRFRELEIEAVRGVAVKKNVVIACGGGIVLNKINIDRLKKESVIICLTASLPVILKRSLKDKDDRPLLNVKDREKQIKELLEYRRPFYNRAADIAIDTSRLSIEAVVNKILETLSTLSQKHQRPVTAKEIGNKLNRAEGSIRNQMQILVALEKVTGIPGLKGGYMLLKK